MRRRDRTTHPIVILVLVAAACGASEAGRPRENPGSTTGARRAADIPVAHTPPGGYGDRFPEPVLAGCREPLTAGAPDLRGLWQVTAVEVGGAPAPRGHPVFGQFQRIEQCGDRLVVTGGGVIHDMRCDGTIEHGVHDVAGSDFVTPVNVVCSYENGVHTLRPVGTSIEVTRRREGADMIWTYVGFTARLRRTGDAGSQPLVPA